MTSTQTQGSQSANPVAAFFDLDGTILSTSSAILYVKYLRRRPKGNGGPLDRMPLTALMKTLWYQVLYNINRIDIDRVADASVLPLAGHPERAMIDMCRAWFDEMVAAFIRPEMPGLIDAHRSAGHQICILTASTPYVTLPLSQKLGIEDWISSQLEIAPPAAAGGEATFTGRLVRPLCYGPGKIALAKRWADPRGIDLARSFFYTDSITDLPMCEAVGTPILVSPDRKLRREGKTRGWHILDLDGKSPFTAPVLTGGTPRRS